MDRIVHLGVSHGPTGKPDMLATLVDYEHRIQMALGYLVDNPPNDFCGPRRLVEGLDYIARVLAGNMYSELVAMATDGTDGPDTYEWGWEES